MNRQIVFVAAAAFALGRLAGQNDPTAAFRKAIMDADRAFDRDTAAGGPKGAAKAWAGWFAADGKMFRANATITQGRADIEALMQPFLSQAGTSLRWQPTFAEVARSGDLGYTTGESTTRTRDDKGQAVEAHGRYVTIWRKQADGSWKVALDIGASTPPRPITSN